MNKLLDNFIRVAAIPRDSGKEEKIADFFVNVAKKNNLYYFKDKNNNVLIKKTGSIPGPSIGIQAHLDMVCEKTSDSNHNFNNDPINVIVNGDIVKANNTTLGADQGVGLAIMLTLIEDKELVAPNIEFIFTVEEETSFNGADTFPYYLLTTKRIINLDSCNDDVVYIGSEADIANEYIYNINYIKNDLPTYKMEITTQCEGNSGEYINESKNNAIYRAFEILSKLNVQLISVFGGKNEDDIANSCAIKFSSNENIDELLNREDCIISKSESDYAINENDSKEIINNVLLMKSGFIDDGISANLGYINTNNNKILFNYLIRSKSDNKLDKYNNLINSKVTRFACNEMYRDDSFKIPNNSKLLLQYEKVYKDAIKKNVKKEICTGGIECAVISSKIKDLDIISIGSNVDYFHTPNERTYISSWVKIYTLLINMLKVCNKN